MANKLMEPAVLWASAREALEALQADVSQVSSALAAACSQDGSLDSGLLDQLQPATNQLAFLASEAAALGALVSQGTEGRILPALGLRSVADLLRSSRHRRLDLQPYLHSAASGTGVGAADEILASRQSPDLARAVVEEASVLPLLGVPEDLVLAAQAFRRFGAEVIAPLAQGIHTDDEDIPDRVIDGLAAMGAFGLSIPDTYGGSLDESQPNHLSMVVASEELSVASLGAGGSLITRPEIMSQALVAGGTDSQKERWLPAIATGEKLVAVAVTEPDAGSDVAAIRTEGRRVGDAYRINGTKTWSTFAGRADLLLVLVRTSANSSRYDGLSLLVVEKPRAQGKEFEVVQAGGGRLLGRAIPTIGYRGMHSFELVFEDWEVPLESLIGGPDGEGKGFYLQMDAFALGRLQTAARSIGVMRAAFDAAVRHSSTRSLFGKHLIDYSLTTDRLASMAASITAAKFLTYRVAGDSTSSQLNAAMVKALACRWAEEVTRDAMQLFGGYGYAEEYAVSRYFVDARVLSLFEGAEEVLTLRVIGRQLIRDALRHR